MALAIGFYKDLANLSYSESMLCTALANPAV